MSSTQFIETLKQIGYPKAQSLTARSFDWMFEDEAVLPFLTWFFNNVGHHNILSEEEKKSYAELEQSGVDILEGAILEEALSCLPIRQTDDVALETLQEEVEHMREDLERLRNRKERLVKTRNSLSMYHIELTHRLAKLIDVENAKKHQYRKSVDKCNRSSVECDASLQRLGENVQRLCSLYGDQSENPESEPVFLSQIGLDAFHKAEENYSLELTTFTKKLFFEGIADIAGGEISRYQLLEVSDPTTLLVKGQSQEEFQLDCQELRRLKAVFPKSEVERINALVQARCAASVSAKADDILRKLQVSQFPSDIQEIRHQLQDLQLRYSQVKGEVELVTGGEGDLARLIKELGALQGTRVLTGDYHLKLARQDYFTSNQDQVIKYLVDQRARNEFLTMAYEVEGRIHRDIHCLLKAVQEVLNSRLNQHQTRMQTMDDPTLTKVKYERGTIDTRDIATTCLHRMLVPSDESRGQHQLFLPYSSMVQAAGQMTVSLAQIRAEDKSIADKYQDRVQNLEKEVVQCEDALYAESSTMGGQPLLIPRQVLEARTDLSDMCHKLEAAIMDTANTASEKKKILKMDVLAMKERELFVNFHLHPDRLKQMLDLLDMRLQAHRVSDK